MCAPPDENAIERILQAEWGLQGVHIRSLDSGADRDSLAFRVEDENGQLRFLKLRRGAPAEAGLSVAQRLRERGHRAFLAPLPARGGALWYPAGEWRAVLWPWLEGENGFERTLTAEHWRQLGVALRVLHQARLPTNLVRNLPRETWGAKPRRALNSCLARCESEKFNEPHAQELTILLRRERAQLDWLLRHAEALARELRMAGLPLVSCHGDIHAGNVLLAKDGHLAIVDWDTSLLAPAERDLMFINGGVGGVWRGDAGEWGLFAGGYGPGRIDLRALTYYRCQRILEDIIDYCEQILPGPHQVATSEREAGLCALASQFAPGQVVAIARRTARALSRSRNRR